MEFIIMTSKRWRRLCLGLLLVMGAPVVNAEENGWETISVQQTYDHHPFTYRMKLASQRPGYIIYKLYYPSPVTTPVEQNNTIPAEYFIPDAAAEENVLRSLAPGESPGGGGRSVQLSGPKRPAVICLHILDGNEVLTDLVCSTLAQRGIPAIMFKLPYYGERALPEGPMAMAKDPRLFASAIAQAAQDVRRTVDLLASRPEVDPQKIGIMGVSLGGLVAATAAGGEPRIARAGLILAGGDLQKIIGHSRETRPLREMIDSLPPEERQTLEKNLEEVDPLCHAPALRNLAAQGRVLMINAAEDEVIPRSCTEKLAAALGMENKVVWLEGLGHYTAMAELPRALKLTAVFFARDLPPGAAPPPVPVGKKTPEGRLAVFCQQLETLLSGEPERGRCHRLELEFTAALPDQKPIDGRLRYVRGGDHQFALACKLPVLGEFSLGQGRFPWAVYGGEKVIEGTLHPEAKRKDPLVLADPGQVAKLKMLSGLLGSMAMVPEVLERLFAIIEEPAAGGGRAIRLTFRNPPGSGGLRLLFDADGQTPKRLEFELPGARGDVVIRKWQINAEAPGTLFQPPAEGTRQAVEPDDVYRIFAALFHSVPALLK